MNRLHYLEFIRAIAAVKFTTQHKIFFATRILFLIIANVAV